MNSQQKQLTDPELWTQLTNAVSARSAQDQTLWTIFGVFWAAEGIMLVALFTTGSLPKNIVGIIVSIAGVLLSLAWHIINKRAILHLDRWDILIERLEKKLNFDTDFAISLKVNFTDAKYINDNHKTPVRLVMRKCSLFSGVLWSILLLWFTYSLVAPILFN
jgi:hypothetical protein